ncbi:MAG: ATP-grasp domain-containing protein [Gammaproteobacteria bacterium]
MNSPGRSSGKVAPLVVVAQSGRALAAAARAAGWSPRVIDRFGDVDTAQVAAEVAVAPVDADGALSVAFVVSTLATWRVHGAPYIVWGGGLEAQPGLLDELSRAGELLGSPRAAIRRLHDPVALAATLRELGIPVPDTREAAPPGPGWLRKRRAAAGGWHVRRHRASAPTLPGEYAQREIPGRAYSFSFVACAGGVEELSFNRPLALQPCAAQPWRYGGAVVDDTLPAAARGQCRDYAVRIATHLGWRGLCGFDFVYDGSRCVIVDPNPRPTATSALAFTPASTFAAHVAACENAPLPPLDPQPGVHGHAVCYAPDAIQIPNSLDWPDWVADRPQPGSLIPAQAPLCTVVAATDRAIGTEDLLAARLAALWQWIAASVGHR